MVHWIWLLVALWIGVFAGFFMAALARAAGRGEREYDDEVRHSPGQHA